MTSTEFGLFALPLLALIAAAQVFGQLFVRLRQPRVIGEILAGVMLGPAVLGRIAPEVSHAVFTASATGGQDAKYLAVIGFLSNLGLLLLMFASGAETNGLFDRKDRREVAWLGGLGTAVPFLITLAIAPLLPLDALMGPAQHRMSLLLVIGIAVAVTSIPVISRIFHDLGILGTRFARLILGVAVIEDIALWGILAVAMSIAAPRGDDPAILSHVATSVLYFGAGLTVLPALVRRASRVPWNVIRSHSPIGWVVTVLLAYAAIAATLGVSLVFAAFLAGYAVVSDAELRPAISSLNGVAYALFIPIYFTIVGLQLNLTREFPIGLAALFIVAACAVKIAAALAGARAARFGWRDSFDLAIALNARGGPGIVLASVAFDAGIINAGFFTTLVLLAIVTSQAAGVWLDRVVRSGRPLLGPDPAG